MKHDELHREHSLHSSDWSTGISEPLPITEPEDVFSVICFIL